MSVLGSLYMKLDTYINLTVISKKGWCDGTETLKSLVQISNSRTGKLGAPGFFFFAFVRCDPLPD